MPAHWLMRQADSYKVMPKKSKKYRFGVKGNESNIWLRMHHLPDHQVTAPDSLALSLSLSLACIVTRVV